VRGWVGRLYQQNAPFALLEVGRQAAKKHKTAACCLKRMQGHHTKKRYNPTTYSGLGGERKRFNVGATRRSLATLFQRTTQDTAKTPQETHKGKIKKMVQQLCNQKKEKTTSGKIGNQKKTCKKQRSTSLKTANHLGGCSGTRQT
jgi:hypothetical protein